MSSHKESGLYFSFPKGWRVIKFDEHRFYKYVNGLGLKGVDFIGIKESGQLLLIEVKNYSDRFPQDGIQPTVDVLENPLFYAENIAHKFDDSFQLIEVIHKYYLRKFWFRKVAIPLLPYLPHHYITKSDWAFWLKAYQHLNKSPKRVDMIWWLELEADVSENNRSLLHLRLLKYFTKYFENSGQFVKILDSRSKHSLIRSKV